MSVPEQMAAAYITSTGTADDIRIGQLPVPRLEAGEVLVKLAASEVNHVDLFVRSGAYRTPIPFPFVVGRDLVGTVESVGEAVEGFAVGDQVWTNSMGHAGRQGTFAEYTAVPVERLYRLPAGVDPADAAPVLHAAGTAYVGLVREAGLKPGQTVLVGAASGAVGSAVVQLAASMGARVIAGASSGDQEWVTDCGASVVVDSRADDYYEQVGAAAPDGVDVWWDTSGRYEFDCSVPLLASGGRMIAMAAMDQSPSVPIGAFYTRDASLRGFAISNASVSDLASAAKSINHLLDVGRLKGRVGATFALRDAAEAHAALESRKVRGRVLIVP